MKTTTLYLFITIFLLTACEKDEDDKYGLENKQLKVELEASEGGTVTGGGNFKFGETINVEAKANENYAFDAWYIDDEKYSTANPFTIKVDDNMKLVAKFALNSYSISLNCEEGGTVTGGGAYKFGETISVEAKANENYAFDAWYIDNERYAVENPLTIKVEKNLRLIAKFLDVLYKVNVISQEGGTVTGGGNFKFGETIYLEAKANEEYLFEGWYIEEEKISDANPLTYKVQKDITITAKFIKNSYTITLINEEGGTVTGGGLMESGTKATIKAQSGEHHTFAGWYENGLLITNDPICSFEVFKSRELTAKFLPKIYVSLDIELYNKTYHPKTNTGTVMIYEHNKINVSTFIYKNNQKVDFFTDEELKFQFNIEHEEAFLAGGSHGVALCGTQLHEVTYNPSLNGIKNTSFTISFKNTRYPYIMRIVNVKSFTTSRNTTSKGQLIVIPNTVTIHRNGSEETYIQNII